MSRTTVLVGSRAADDAALSTIRGARMTDGAIVDITVDAGRIAAIEPASRTGDDDHLLVTPALADVHLHADKAYLLGDLPASNTVAEAIAAVRANKPNETAGSVFERTMRLLADCRRHGTLAVRLHAEVDPDLELRAIEGVLAARAETGDAMSIQVCAFAQDGIVSRPGTEALLRAAVGLGADVIGGITYSADPLAEHLQIVTALARELGVPLDLHADLSLPAGTTDLPAIADSIAANGLQGRVLLGHCTSLPLLAPDSRADVLRSLADVDAAVVVLPRTDLFFDGRIASIEECTAAGISTHLATNNVENPFTPIGPPSLPQVAAVYALANRVASVAGLEALAALLWSARSIIDGELSTVSVGSVADLCLWPVESAWQLVTRAPLPSVVIRAGRIVP
ncbi:MAG: N-acyl-D-amino-acid deacylase [Ilumatobacteraceae bacterium]|nr:N-acyl-D-amino-acid deacylase [Ilumatobacteraceae bacterium]